MNKHIGSSLNDFLGEEDLLVESELVAIKRIISMEIQKGLCEQQFTKTEFADRIGTSRAAINRILNPENTSITLHTLEKAARGIGKHIHISLA